jgi:hypothetical protein
MFAWDTGRRATAVDGALEKPGLALKLIQAIDPPVAGTVSVDMPTTVEQVNELSLAELQALVATFPEPPEQLSPS